MIFDATKVIYNTYSCAISGMSRESTKMDGRDSVECQNWRKKGQNWHFLNCLSDTKDKARIVLVFFKTKEAKRGNEAGDLQWAAEIDFRERTSSFSLKYWAIRPSAVFGTRRKAALRGAGYAWTSDLRSFDKLLEVGVSPYLGFIHSLSTLSMFELNEAVRGRLIGPKTWDRIVGNFFRNFLQSVTVGAVMG